MYYSAQKTAEEWRYMLAANGQVLIDRIDEGYVFYKKWYDYTYGKANADIATALSITETEVVEMHNGFAVFNALAEAMHNTAVAASDRLSALLKFTF